MSDKEFLIKYEKLLDRGYCNCNEMNCIDNNSPRKILNIVKTLQKENEELKEELQKANDTLDTHNELINYLQKENEELKEINKQLCKELNTSNMSEEEWLDYAINYNLEELEKRINILESED